ncbi:transglutaminase-like cysteine peptidase [Sneathiella limimaris]|uniref:transglutaminase-like cysteine peptidase n=1 Tax=Sneathiella limimaris TaxID=1964213 RepID=UPI00146C1A48|nr:transglutaminase-like cysteine peptidase [Sneathiella limimaris]
MKTLLRTSLVLGCLISSPTAAFSESPDIFGFKAYTHTDLKPFPKWRKVLNTYKNEPGPCGNGQLNACAYDKWKELIDQLKDEPKKYQLTKVNSYLNLYRYVLDPINWGIKDYWEIPKEFFAKFGDCEDYAIVKYFTLRALGWDADDMKIVVLQDMNLRIAHAILTVKFEEKKMVLDNQIGLVIDAKRIRHYRPIYALNENGWWRYKPS